MWCRRNRALAFTAAAAVILLIVSCLGLTLSQMLRSQRDIAVQAEESARAHEHLAKATSHIVSARPERRWRALEEIDHAVKLRSRRSVREGLRDEAITALATTDVRVELLKWADVLPLDVMDPADAANMQPRFAMAPDLRQVAIGLPQRNKIVVVDVRSRRLIVDIPQTDFNHFLLFSPASTFLTAQPNAAAGYLSVWSLATGQRVFYAKEHSTHAVSPDDHWLAFGQRDKSVRLVDLRNPQTVKSFDAEGIPYRMAFSPDGKRIAVCYAGRARVVSIVNCETLEIEQRLETGSAECTSWHPDGSRLAVATGSRTQWWNVNDNRRLAVTDDHASMVDSCEVVASGEFLVTTCWDGNARLWDLNNMRQVVAMERFQPVVPEKDDTVIGFRSLIGGIELVRVERRPFLFSLDTDLRSSAFPIAAQFTSNELALVTLAKSGFDLRELQIWDTITRRRLATTEVDQLHGAAFDSRGQRLTVVHGDKVSSLPVRLVGDSQLEIGPPRTVSLPGQTVYLCGISGDGTTIAMINQGKLHVVRLRDESPESTSGPVQLDRVAEFDLPFPHERVQLSSDGNWVVTHGWHSQVLCLWELKRKELVREMQFLGYVTPSFTPDSSQLVTSEGDAFRFLNLSTLTPGLTLPREGVSLPGPIAIHEGGRLAVASLQANELQLVELPSGRILARLRRPQQENCLTLGFNQTGTSFFEGNNMSGLLLWDLSRLQDELGARGLDLVDLGLSARQTPHCVESVKLIGVEGWSMPTHIGMMTESMAGQRLEELETTLRENPESLHAANNLAWQLCMAPAALRNADRALELAESVVHRSDKSTYRNTLAAAYYRQGEFQKAVTLLEENLSLSPDYDIPWDLVLLSLSHAALGHEEQAKNYLELTRRIMNIDIGAYPLVTGDDRAALDAFLQEAETAIP
jgi:WD40 repeat protein